MTSTGIRYDTGPTIAVAVDDMTASWNDGHFVGDKELVFFAEQMAAGEIAIRVFNQIITASYTDPLGALAAMAGFSPGRAVVTEAPEAIYEAIAAEPGLGFVNDEDGHEVITDDDEIVGDDA